MSEEQAKDIWYLLEQASYHLQNPTPEGCWEHPEDVASLRQLLREKPDQVHEGDGGEWYTPLHKAAYLHLCDIARVLLELGADPNACPLESGWTPLHEAVRRSYGEDRDAHFIQVLLDHGADPNRADMNGQTPLDIAWGRDADVLRGYGGQVNLNTACRLGLVDKVNQLLQGDPDAIQKAPEPGRLVSDAVGCCYMEKNEAEALEIISLLLQHGANINFADSKFDGGTPVYHACGGGAPVSVIRLLLLHGADVNSADHNGDTPLDVARKCNRQDVVEMLLRAGGRGRQS